MDERFAKPCFFCWLIIRIAFARRGHVSEELINRRYDCPLANKKVFTMKSELQCTHRCLHNDMCELINFNLEKTVEGNCEILVQTNQCRTTLWKRNWKAMIFKHERTPKVYKSCKGIYNDNSASVSGIYEIETGKHFCIMEDDTGSCGVGGWTLAIKIDGSKTTFMSSSSYWTNDETYNIGNGIKSLYEVEAKFPAFSKVSFDNICIGMKVGSDVRWLRIPEINKASLLTLFKAGNALYTNLARSSWKNLIAGSSLQLNCNRQGINVKDSGNSILSRIGYITNQENDCATCDSFIGIGSSRFSMSCGNFATSQYSPDNGGKDTPAMCYVLIQ